MEDKLRKLGLTGYEIKLYLTLLEKGELTGGELSKKSGVPHGKTYEGIEKLEEKGFVSILPMKPKLIKAIEPKTALTIHTENKVKEIQALMEEAVVQLQHVKQKKDSESSLEKIIVLRGKKNMLPIIHHYYATAQHYLKILFTYEYNPYSMLRILDEKLHKGVKIQQLTTKIPEKSKPLIREMLAKGVEIRYYPVEELRLVVKDGEQSLHLIVNRNDFSDSVSLVIESKEFTKALEMYFDTLWKKATPIQRLL